VRAARPAVGRGVAGCGMLAAGTCCRCARRGDIGPSSAAALRPRLPAKCALLFGTLNISLVTLCNRWVRINKYKKEGMGCPGIASDLVEDLSGYANLEGSHWKAAVTHLIL
jgi:hypothetical protein